MEVFTLEEMQSSISRPATARTQMHFQSLDIVKKSFLTCRYGLNGTKHILHITPGRSDCSVPTIANNCMDNNTRSFIAFGFMISCQANNANIAC